MAPLSIATIEGFNEEQVEKQAIDVYDVVSQWDVPDDVDFERLYKMFQILQMSSETVVNNVIAEKDDKINELNRKEAEIMRSKEASNEKIEELEREAKRKDTELSSKTSDLEKHIKDLTDELATSKNEREILQQKASDAENTRVLSEKRKTEHEDQRRGLEHVKDKLEKETEELTNRMKEANEQLEDAAEEIQRLRTQIQNSDADTNELRSQNQRLEFQISELKQRVMSRTEDDDQIMNIVNKRIEEWKVLLGAKEAEISDLRRVISELQQQLTLATADADRASVGMLTRALAERDEQIENLQKKLREATNDIEKHAVEIDAVKRVAEQRGGREDPQLLLFDSQKMIKNQETHIKDLENRCEQAEHELLSKDKMIFEQTERMQKYEAGYGLRDAVEEIKHYKDEVGKRDKQLIEMSRLANECELQLNKLYDENEHFREKLGLGPAEPVDMTEYKAYAVQQRMSDRLLNQVLQKEIELLESERSELKAKLRMLANKIPKDVRGAVVSDDLMAELRRPVSKNVEDLIRRNHQPTALASQPPKSGRAEILESGIEVSKLHRDLADQSDKLETTSAELGALRNENVTLKQDLTNLSTALTELDKMIRKGGIQNQAGQIIECPSLDRFVSSLEVRNLSGDDMSAWLRAELDRFHGRCAELREENRTIRQESIEFNAENAKLKHELNTLKAELEESGAGMRFQRFKLPDSMAPTSAEAIAALTDHLVNVLHENSVKDKLLSESRKALNDYKRQISIIRHQQSLVYDEYATMKSEFDSKLKSAQDLNSKLEALRKEDAVKLDEFEKMLTLFSNSASNPDDLEGQYRKHVVETTRRATVARVSEKRTAVHLESAEFENASLKRENDRLKADSLKLQSAVMERIGSLQRFKEAALFRVSFLQRQLDQSVPLNDYEVLGKKLDESNMQYRELLERQQTMIDASRVADDLRMASEGLRRENDNLKKELIAEKEIKAGFQAVVEDFAAKGVVTDAKTALSSGHFESISRKLAALEMKELNERERAEHAVRIQEQLKQVVDQLENRNKDLESRFSEVSKLNLDSQKVERELRDELSNCVPRNINEADRVKLMDLEKNDVVLKNEVSQLKEVRDVAVFQRKAVELGKSRSKTELESLRNQVREFQAQSDEKAMIVRLHGQLLQLQASEAFAVAQLEGSQQRVASLELELAKVERRLEDREHTLHFQRTESSNRIRQLRKTVHSLRQQYIGSVPLSQQEKVTKSLIELEESKQKIAEDLREASNRREAAEIELETAKRKQQDLEELLAAIKEDPSAAAYRLTEWHQKLESLRLEDLRNRRLIMRLEDQIKVDESAIARREQLIATLEAELVSAKRELEMQQIDWEQREIYLEQSISNLEKQLGQISTDAEVFSNELEAMPDATLPTQAQLDQAKQTIRTCVKGLLEKASELKMLRKKVEDNEQKLRDAETGLLHQNKFISELRVRLSPTEQAAAMTAVGGAEPDLDGERPDVDEAGPTGQLRRQLRVARTSIESLKRRLEHKDETIGKFEQLVAQLRADMDVQQRNYEDELQKVQARLTTDRNMLADEMNASLMAAARSNQFGTNVPSSEMIARLHELEDVEREQRRVINDLHEKLNSAELKLNRSKADASATLGKIQLELDNHRANKEEERGGLLRELDNARRQAQAERTANERLEIELSLERSKGPSVTLRSQIDKLKSQIGEKDKKVKQLTAALADVRGELLKQAEVMAKMKTDDSVSNQHVEKLVEKRTKDINSKLQSAEKELGSMKQALKDRKDNDAAMREEIHRLKDDLGKKTATLSRLKSDKQRLEGDVDDLRRQLERPLDKPKTPRGSDEAQTLRDQLRSKEAECVQLTRSNDILKGALERIGRERDDLLTRINALDSSVPSDTLGLKLELDALRKEASKLRQKNEDLEKYLDLLKTENSQLSGRGGSNGGLSQVSGNVRRIGDSGRTPADLEKTIALMKKVIDRLQLENEQLKQQPLGLSSSESSRLRNENRDLRDKIHELEQTLGQAVSERYSAVERGAAKLSSEYDKLRGDLKREIEARQRSDLVKEQLARELAEAKQKLALTAEQQMDDKKSTKLKQSADLADLDRHRQRVAELTNLLQDAADRERKLVSDLDKAKQENSKLRKELGSFGPKFLEELENLKHSYAQLSRENIDLKHQLKQHP